MFRLPIPTKIGRDFLDGEGHLEINTDKNALDTILSTNQSFVQTADPIADVTVGADATKDLSFGRKGSLNLSLGIGASFTHQLQVLWPGQDDTALSQAGLALAEGMICARAVMNAKADGSAQAGFPVGPLSATVGIAAGAGAHYERWITRRTDSVALGVVTDLYSGLRLPQSIDDVAAIPDPGEVLLMRYNGYLRLNAGVTWGYSLTGTKDIDVNKLALDLDYKLRAMAAVSVGYQLAGEHQIEARRGSDPTWVRFVVRKSRNSETTLAADFGFTADLDLKGLPDSADEFLSKLLGAHADRIIELFNQGRKYANLDELEKAAGKLLMPVIGEFSQKVLETALDNASVAKVVARMNQIAAAYANFDARLIALYNDFAKKDHSGINGVIDTILNAGSKEGLAKLSGAAQFAPAIDLLRRLYNDKIFDVLQNDGAFADALGLLKHAKQFLNGESDQEIAQWIDLIQKQLPVDGLLRQLSTMNVAQLKALADDKLKGLVEQLVGKAFAQLKDSDFKNVVDLVSNNLAKIDAFKKKWYAAMQKAAKQSFQANLNIAYSRTRRNEKLLDVEVNLAAADGPRLAAAAASGDFVDLLQNYNTEVVRIRQGAFSTQLQNSLGIKLNVLGFGSEGIVTLVQQSDHTIEPQNGGLLHLYASQTYVERRQKSGWKFKEELSSKFLVQATGETFQPAGASFQEYAASVVKSMSADYDLTQSDERTTTAELTQYLIFANAIGLLQQDPASFVQQLLTQCGGDLGNVKVTYSVRFDPTALPGAFHFSGDTLSFHARDAMRSFMQRKFAKSPVTDWFPRIAFAYTAAQAFKWFREGSLRANLRGVVLPAWYTGGAPQEVGLTSEMVTLVDRMFRFEDKIVEALLGVDAQVDSIKAGKTIDFRKLNEAIKKMVDAAGDVGEYDASCFPAVLDRLIQIGSPNARRDSTVLIEVTPAKGPLAGKKVTHMIAAGPRNPAEIAEDDTETAAVATKPQ